MSSHLLPTTESTTLPPKEVFFSNERMKMAGMGLICIGIFIGAIGFSLTNNPSISSTLSHSIMGGGGVLFFVGLCLRRISKEDEGDSQGQLLFPWWDKTLSSEKI